MPEEKVHRTSRRILRGATHRREDEQAVLLLTQQWKDATEDNEGMFSRNNYDRSVIERELAQNRAGGVPPCRIVEIVSDTTAERNGGCD
jgi:hypothetical protein